MERWGERLPQRGRCGDHHPSFSSSLLDAIYRSIDDESDAAVVKSTRGAPDPALFAARTTKHTDAAYHPAAAPAAAVTRSRSHNHHHRQLFTSTSSSSDGSSYGGFSSSDAESGSSRRPALPRPIRTSQAQTAPPVQEKKAKPGSIRNRFRDLRKTRQPASPGARLASFLNSLFAAGGGPKKPKYTAAPPPPQPDSSACSTASSFSRSCLSKTPPSSRGRVAEKRSVRFGPVSVIAAKDQADRTGPVPAFAAQKRVEEILRSFNVEDEDEDDVASDASSDLFELENLTVVGVGGGRYTDELPVYETTHFGTNLALARSGKKKEGWI